MPDQVRLPAGGGRAASYTMSGRQAPPPPQTPGRGRIAYAAAHVVADALADTSPVEDARIDWSQTLAFREYLWRLGLGVAEAMDTAQRGGGLGWPAARELIRRSCAAARSTGGLIACGAATDQLPAGARAGIEAIEAAYEEQCSVIEDAGGKIVLMASRALAASARGAEDYVRVYTRLLAQFREPAIIHWLGPMFDPHLAGYWGREQPAAAAEVLLRIVEALPGSVDGIKLSLLDAQLESDLRRRLPPGVRLYTGDDFNFQALIRGDAAGHSEAMLGVFDPLAPVAATALAALDSGDVQTYDALLAPATPLAACLFETPTRHYKTGIVFLAYLNGHQDHFRMLGGEEGARSAQHLARVFALADRAGVFINPALAAARMRSVMSLAGVA